MKRFSKVVCGLLVLCWGLNSALAAKVAIFKDPAKIANNGPSRSDGIVDGLNGQEGIAAYELNISCPNVQKEGRCPALSPEDTYTTVKKVKKTSRRPVIAKLSPNVTDIAAIALSAQEAGADAVSLVNTFLALAIDADTRRPKIANIFGGLSGPAIKPIALRMVFQTAQRLRIPVIGMGGITTGEDAAEFLLAGASAIQVGTANFIDPESTVRILSELEEFCTIRDIQKVGDLVGTLDVEMKSD